MLTVQLPRHVPADPPLRIGLLAPPWLTVPPTAYGGTEAVIHQLATGLTAQGHEVLLWAATDSTCPVRRGGIANSDPSIMGRSAREISHAAAGHDWLEQRQCDVIHDHTLAGPFVATGRVPVVVTNHGPFSDPDLGRVFRAAQRRCSVVAISHDQAARGRALGIEIRSVIHHGVDIAGTVPGDGEGDETGEYFLFLGRMSPEKGVEDAVRLARAAGVRLLIAAKMREKSEFEYFRDAVAPFCDGRQIRYVGEVGGPEKARLLGGAVALLNPIAWPEPFGMVMIEALAAGTPVIARDVGSAAEIVRSGTTGFLCEDDRALLNAIRSVGRIDRRACRQDALARFDTSRMARDHVDLYRSLIATGATTVGAAW